MFSFVSALANLITKILPFILMRKAGADAAIKKGFEKVAKLRNKKINLKQTLLVLPLVMLLASCLTNGNVTTDSCSLLDPILIHDDDRLTNGTARQILIHNESWEELCQ